MSLVSLSRKVTFSSGHRYWRESLTPEENRALFGEWASPFNHGHNYVLWVTARGPVDPDDGMVVNIKSIDDQLQKQVVKVFDQKSINDEVVAFASIPPTTENLVAHFRDNLTELPGGVELCHIKLEESPRLWAEWNKDTEMITLSRSYEFAASHRLHVPTLSDSENRDLFGKCNNLHGHGHNYILEVTVSGEVDPATGMMVDIGKLDDIVEEMVVDRYDHKNLDKDIPEFRGKNTTSELVTLEIFNRLQGQVPGTLERIRLYETARNMFEVNR